MMRILQQQWIRVGIAVLLSFFVIANGYAQTRTVKGKVVDVKNQPIIGASVKIVGTSTGTITDVNGLYSLSATSKDKLQFSFMGYTSKEEVVGNRSVINVILEESNVQMQDIVVVGYGTQRKANLTGAVATVDTKILDARPITDVSRGLEGVAPGLTITAPTGDLGVNPSIKLRGSVGSLGNGASSNGAASPLILVDGVEVPNLMMINPNDIASISVLKDASSSAIYGARATWGVILITTKQGKFNQRAVVDYSVNFSENTPTITMNIADAPTNAAFLLAVNQRANPTNPADANGGFVYANASTIQTMKDWLKQYGNKNLGEDIVRGRDYDIIGGKFYGYRTYDPTHLYLKRYTPMSQHNISVSGGGEKISYNLSGAYLNQSGLLKVNPDSYKRYNLTANINGVVNKWLELRLNSMLSNSDYTTPFNLLNTASRYNAFYYMYRWSSFSPYGYMNGQPVKDAVNAVRQANDNTTDAILSRVTIAATAKILEGLTFDADYTFSNQDTRATVRGGDFYALNTWGTPNSSTPSGFNYGIVSTNTNYIEEDFMYERTRAFNGYFTYKKKIDKHDLKVTAGVNTEDFIRNGYISKKANLLINSQANIGLASGTQTVGVIGAGYLTSSPTQWATAGAFGRINYSYDDKYLLEYDMRYDGSSLFPAANRWAVFPSGSLGWRFTQEPFMRGITKILTSGKLRASYGMLGNQDVAANSFISTLTPYYGTNVNVGGSLWYVNGANQTFFGTPTTVSTSLTWEKVTTADFGADLQLINDLNITYDWYQRVTSGMITAGSPVPLTFGTTAAYQNFGALTTKGWELQLNYRHIFNNGLTINLSAGLSDYIETITKWVYSTSYTGYRVGQRIGAVYGYKFDRLFNVDDFQRDANNAIAVSSGQYQLKPGIATQSKLGTFGPGDVKYKDLNGDGVIDAGDGTVANHGDMSLLGYNTPRDQYNFTIGASWKGFDLNMFFQGVGSCKNWIASSATLPGFDTGNSPSLLTTQTNYWYTPNVTDPSKSDYFVSQVKDPVYPRPSNSGSSSTGNFQVSDKYMQNLAYLRLKNLAVGYSFPKSMISKAFIQNLRIYISIDNLLTFDHVTAPIDPETGSVGDAIAYGRSYPFVKAYSAGLQVKF
ncbi:SusC/RagA family TonB-linked outer membrane protein [Microbacter margulisiae]|uniref:TonB-linked SusC/RagA family outer membrane protein n=1 Tax=Microbacter margulisiae TaxID=1350067 RepID=A0A7W5H2W7_9PORP|nr:TonB-dependent receptor [Microbacter margulisiae]MBB3188210.1 TonB-linked SusC/RagA family outer membrane protein [Microbacter margulisiae]